MKIISILIPTLFLIYHILNIYQQEHYNYLKLLKSFKKLYTSKIYIYVLYIMLILSLFSFSYIEIIYFILSIIPILFRTKYIIKLKFTNRIIRLLITTSIIYSLIFIFNNKLIYIIISILLYPFMIYIINIINKPVDFLINNYYLKKAKEKLRKCKNLIKIAITGSYGKTTVKDIIYEILSKNYVTLKTPKSFNTLLGITKTINESLNNTVEILIVEMGATTLGEIKKMTKFINPDISVITSIGKQHMSSFKKIENVINAKLEIINYDLKDSITILNADNIYLKNIYIKDKKIIKTGNENIFDIYTLNKKIKNNTQTFNIIDKINNTTLNIKTNLLGKHNINNILLSFAVAKQFNISNNEFKNIIDKIEPTPHRLSYIKKDNIHIFDDSYNSNIIGFKNAIDVLFEQNTKKIIITPGIVDAGIISKDINEEIARYINTKNIDNVYLINNEITKYYTKILNNYLVFNNFISAYNHLINTYTLEEVSLLIENDLPDNYFER